MYLILSAYQPLEQSTTLPAQKCEEDISGTDYAPQRGNVGETPPMYNISRARSLVEFEEMRLYVEREARRGHIDTVYAL